MAARTPVPRPVIAKLPAICSALRHKLSARRKATEAVYFPPARQPKPARGAEGGPRPAGPRSCLRGSSPRAPGGPLGEGRGGPGRDGRGATWAGLSAGGALKKRRGQRGGRSLSKMGAQHVTGFGGATLLYPNSRPWPLVSLQLSLIAVPGTWQERVGRAEGTSRTSPWDRTGLQVAEVWASGRWGWCRRSRHSGMSMSPMDIESRGGPETA